MDTLECHVTKVLKAKWVRPAESPVFDLWLQMPKIHNLLVGRACL